MQRRECFDFMPSMKSSRLIRIAAMLAMTSGVPATAYATNLVAVGAAGLIRQSPDSGATWFTRTSPTTQNLTAVDCLGNSCWAVGGNGVRIKSIDAGVTWTSLPTSDANWGSVDFINQSVGWVVGNHGRVSRTTNGGANWTAVDVGQGTMLFYYNINFINEQVGWLVGDGGRVLYTSDGGNNWTPHNASTGWPVLNTYFLDANNGFYVGDFSVGKTNDAGVTWQDITPSALTNNFAEWAYFSDSQTGFVANTQQLYFTNDGGASWVSGPIIGNHITDLSMLNSSIGWLTDTAGSILITTDGGHTWSPQATSSTALYDITEFQPSVPGDFNSDGLVNMADYVVWRDTNGTQTDYDLWRSHFGQTLSSGTGSLGGTNTVPEPAGALCLVIGTALLGPSPRPTTKRHVAT